ncbi:MAG: HAMP domain-containing protein, partial [Chloroflexi bacterium]|nr:HAMP domain-containing protein [Chloroflexota bacterium]
MATRSIGLAAKGISAKAPSFRRRVLVALLVVGVLPIAIAGALSIRSTRDQLTALAVANIRQRSASTAGAIDQYLKGRLGDIEVVAATPDVIRYAADLGDPTLKAAARDAMKAMAARAPEYESVAVVDPGGTIVDASIPSDEGVSVKFRDYFLSARAGQPYISDPAYSVITEKPALFFSAPIKNAQGQVLAVARTRVDLGAIWDLVEADAGSVGAGSHGMLLDDYGIRLAVSETKGHRDRAEQLIYRPIAAIDAQTAQKLQADKRFGDLRSVDQLVVDPIPSLKQAIDGMRSSGVGSVQFAYGAGGGEQRGVATSLTTKKWTYVLAVPIATYTRSADTATLDTVVMLLIGTLLAVIVGLLLTRSLVDPLRRLVRAATDVSVGNVDLRTAHFDARVGDDITREVASAFDRLLNALRYYAFADDAA